LKLSLKSNSAKLSHLKIQVTFDSTAGSRVIPNWFCSLWKILVGITIPAFLPQPQHMLTMLSATCPCIKWQTDGKVRLLFLWSCALELITGHPPISTTESVMNESLVAWVSSLYMAFESIFQVLDMPLS
jgi:hypothetical protein